jgi:hypothetical protein
LGSKLVDERGVDEQNAKIQKQVVANFSGQHPVYSIF